MALWHREEVTTEVEVVDLEEYEQEDGVDPLDASIAMK